MQKLSIFYLIDFWVGVPLCAFLSLCRRVRSLLPARNVRQSNATKKILFIELSEMGSAIIAHSALSRASLLHRNCELYFLIFERNAPSVRILNVVPPANVITIDETGPLKFVVSTLKAIWQLRKSGLDLAIDLELYSRFTAMLSFLSGAVVRVGFHGFRAEGLYRGSLITHKVQYNPHRHMTENFIALVEATQHDPADTPLVKQNLQDLVVPLPRLSATNGAKEYVSRLLPEDANARFIVLNPHPGILPLRGWPVEHYAKVARALVELNPGNQIVVIGLDSRQSLAPRLFASLPPEQCIDLSGRTRDLMDVFALLERASLFITGDSGPAHFAALVGTPTIVIFGPETPALYAPLSPNVCSISAGLHCSPCYSAANHRRSPCKNNVCMQAVAPEQVLKMAAEQLGKS